MIQIIIKGLKKISGLLIGLSLLALFFHIADFSWRDVAGRITGSAGWQVFFAFTVFTAALFYLSALKWKYIVVDLTGNKINVPLRHLFHYTAICYLFAFVLPQPVSDVGIRGLSLNRGIGVRLSKATYSVLLDQLINVMIGSLFVLPAVALLSKTLTMPQTLALTLMIVSLFLIIFRYFNRPILSAVAHFYFWFVRLIYRMPFLNKKLGQNHPAVSDFFISQDIVMKVMASGLARHLMFALRLYAMAVLLRLDIGFFILVLATSMTLLLGLVSFIPAQLGLGELGWYGLLLLAGASNPDAVTFVVSARIFHILAVISIAGITWLVLRILSGKS